MYLTREQILNSNDIQTEVVDVPEWGGKVLIRGLSGAERDSFEASVYDFKGRTPQAKFDNLRAKLVARSIVDEEGKLVFTPADIDALGGKSASALDRVFTAAQRLSRISSDDVEELTKN